MHLEIARIYALQIQTVRPEQGSSQLLINGSKQSQIKKRVFKLQRTSTENESFLFIVGILNR